MESMRRSSLGVILLIACAPADPTPDASIAPAVTVVVDDRRITPLVDAVAKLPAVIGKYSGDDPVGANPAYLVYQDLADAIDAQHAIALLARALSGAR